MIEICVSTVRVHFSIAAVKLGRRLTRWGFGQLEEQLRQWQERAP